MMYSLKRCLSVLLIAILVSSCSRGMEPEQRQRAQQTPSEINIYSKDQSQSGTSGTIVKGTTPPLEGGAEKLGRPKELSDNRTLVNKYPKIMALHASGKTNQVALTFDDGPDRRFTPQVLDVLKKHGVKATFFLVGSRVTGHPDVTQRIHKEGHIIGNHTYWHPKIFAESIGRMKWEANETDKVIRDIVGYSPKLFRAPYGGLNESRVEGLGAMNFSVIGWSVDSMDWKQIDSAAVQKNVMSKIHPGAIILMHSGGHWTQDLSGMVEAVDELIPALKKKGLTFVTVSQLLGIPHNK
ncbi:polysaccharide deacetylase family protein [Paenibacillus alkaliterrae]|uniref:polysaccharide deacetylase family protein n=1 Tax=Paenibacillus alkaliterrae TaxID=320909 RepID=UPI001F475746|nr:polysaccharide deacetylase family protein [Paenibacillus alkaliterrae]MCF2941024.1 polysaccharide deacetylase family protein [Paenibacillus alkaliterrae]